MAAERSQEQKTGGISMTYQLFYTPHEADRLDRRQPCRQSIGDILLNFGNNPPTNSRICRTVTVPDENSEAGWRVAACQVFVPIYRWKVIVDLLDRDKMFEFREMILRIGGRDQPGYVSQPLDFEQFQALNLSPEEADQYDWFHFTGTAPELLEELKKRVPKPFNLQY
jgi:hypothetical protein